MSRPFLYGDINLLPDYQHIWVISERVILITLSCLWRKTQLQIIHLHKLDFQRLAPPGLTSAQWSLDGDEILTDIFPMRSHVIIFYNISNTTHQHFVDVWNSPLIFSAARSSFGVHWSVKIWFVKDSILIKTEST